MNREHIRAVLERLVLPHADTWEQQGGVPSDAWRALGAEGLFSIGNFADGAVLLEELGRTGYAGIRAAIGVHAYMATSYLDMFGSELQRSTWLDAARRGERVAALAISEADAGSDLRRLSTRAVATDGGFVVDGEKWYVSNGSRAGFYVVLVKSRDTPAAKGLSGSSLVVIPADSPGVTAHRQPMLGWHSADVCRVVFRDVFVPDEALIGRRDRALTMLMRALDVERLVAGLLAVGGAFHCLDVTHRYARERMVKDAPLSTRQTVRHRLAELTAEYEMVRGYAFHAVARHGAGELDTRTASIVKLRATQLATDAAQACLQFHGAQGYLGDATAARIYRDAAAGTIAGGASELLRDMIFDAGWPPE